MKLWNPPPLKLWRTRYENVGWVLKTLGVFIFAYFHNCTIAYSASAAAAHPDSPVMVRVAAANSSEAEKVAADFVCTGTNDEAVEENPGAWHGFISYTLQGKAFGLNRFWADGSGINFRTENLNHSRTGRPKFPEYLETYFDKATKKTLTWDGTVWVDAMGNSVE